MARSDDKLTVIFQKGNKRMVVKSPLNGNNSATQVAGGGGTDSTGGTNAAIESLNTKQQHAVGGGPGSVAYNKSAKSNQKGKGKKKRAAGTGKKGRSAAASKAVENQRKDKGNRAKSSGGTGSVRFRREGFH
ncbi:hypothetical protein P9G84_12160 [Brevibacillus centrosporus]|uniref:hypothetical protein n=1 Tax=Brevibacillus centrosporus TaxID=54910 RepID=UPI000F0A01DA|nr:hypothetical protein [Brevibacillus centrosporus]MEC2129723.1 hypothetical protein [Brevibacillus centrosporus]RNB67214.1 hypothetical protein EDM55_20910 [Brevibacillus centrosporus]GED32924.1 hypothetical protein BCE02nite_40650 [Brevibacillus centrosporus]